MPLFWKPYTSDTTAFIAELKRRKPSLEEEQRRGRGLLWDKRQDAELVDAFRAGRVRQQAYVYQTQVGADEAAEPAKPAGPAEGATP